MVRETINGTFRQTNLPNESEEYLSKREELRRAEIELMNQRERVAELRRRLPKGPAVEDYVFVGNLEGHPVPAAGLLLATIWHWPGTRSCNRTGDRADTS